jgi:hypothetical protein
MPKVTPDYNLYVLKPDLVKEWHPTKNVNLRPRDVTPGSGKKVWWICEAGHEWQAAIYSRSRGSGCRFCKHPPKSVDGHRALSVQSLIREWHPTKNGDLNPRYMAMLHGEKVWWICEKSHEWQATVTSRTNGEGCPFCENEFVKKRFQRMSSRINPKKRLHNDIYQKDSLETYFGTEFRKSKRFKQEATAIVEVPNSGYVIYAQMQNLSKGGMYFETEVAIKPGTKITVKFDKPIFNAASKIFTSIVKWCKGLSDDKGIINTYGFGVQFI